MEVFGDMLFGARKCLSGQSKGRCLTMLKWQLVNRELLTNVVGPSVLAFGECPCQLLQPTDVGSYKMTVDAYPKSYS